MPSGLDRFRVRDPRLYQIVVLGSLLFYGVLALDLEVEPLRAAVLIGSSLLTQYVFTVSLGLPRFDPRSVLISALSLCLLLRTGSHAIAAAAGAITIGSKFLIRFDGKHLFNPTNVGIAATILLTGRAWVSPGQWGSGAYFAFLLACLGGLVVNRAARSDVTLAFIGFYAGILFGRAAWLGDPFTIPLHQLGSGAFLIFSFFMISDPKTTPDSRAGRILFAFLVAAGAGYCHFVRFRPNGLIWSLAALSPIVPLLDRLLPGGRYEWAGAAGSRIDTRKGGTHAEIGFPASRRRPRLALSEAGRGLLRLLRREGGHEDVQPGLAGGPGPGR